MVGLLVFKIMGSKVMENKVYVVVGVDNVKFCRVVLLGD